jgi:uncharacterized protein with PQ loop repeat
MSQPRPFFQVGYRVFRSVSISFVTAPTLHTDRGCWLVQGQIASINIQLRSPRSSTVCTLTQSSAPLFIWHTLFPLGAGALFVLTAYRTTARR